MCFPLCAMLHPDPHVHYGYTAGVHVVPVGHGGREPYVCVSFRRCHKFWSNAVVWPSSHVSDILSPTTFSLLLGAWLAQRHVTVGTFMVWLLFSQWTMAKGNWRLHCRSPLLHRQNAHAGSNVSSHIIQASLVQMSHLQIATAWNTCRDPCTKGQRRLPKAVASARGWTPPTGKTLTQWGKTAGFCLQSCHPEGLRQHSSAPTACPETLWRQCCSYFLNALSSSK